MRHGLPLDLPASWPVITRHHDSEYPNTTVTAWLHVHYLAVSHI